MEDFQEFLLPLLRFPRYQYNLVQYLEYPQYLKEQQLFLNFLQHPCKILTLLNNNSKHYHFLVTMKINCKIIISNAIEFESSSFLANKTLDLFVAI